MEQQTAVDFIIENLPQIDWDDPFYVGLLQEAKAMEKEQQYKCASFWRGKENEIEKPIFDLYYNETYNK